MKRSIRYTIRADIHVCSLSTYCIYDPTIIQTHIISRLIHIIRVYVISTFVHSYKTVYESRTNFGEETRCFMYRMGGGDRWNGRWSLMHRCMGRRCVKVWHLCLPLRSSAGLTGLRCFEPLNAYCLCSVTYSPECLFCDIMKSCVQSDKVVSLIRYQYCLYACGFHWNCTRYFLDPGGRVVWLGCRPRHRVVARSSRGRTVKVSTLLCHRGNVTSHPDVSPADVKTFHRTT